MCGLLVDPFAKDFLLGPHLLDELVDAVGQPKQPVAILSAAPDDALLDLLRKVGDAALHVEKRETELRLRSGRIATHLRCEAR